MFSPLHPHERLAGDAPVSGEASPSAGEEADPSRSAAVESWLEGCVECPVFAALVHVAEVGGLIAGADAVAARVYQPPVEGWRAYVGTAGLDVEPERRCALHRWPASDHGLFAQVERLGPTTDRAVGCDELLPETDRGAAEALPPPLSEHCRLADSFVVTVPTDRQWWVALVLLRHRHRRAFSEGQRQAVLERRGRIRQVLRRADAAHPAGPMPEPLLARLSPTERCVLELLCRGHTERQAADQLDRSPNTIHVHVKNIYRKLRVRTRRELLASVQRAVPG